MCKKILLLFLLSLGQSIFSQNIVCIEFESSNAITLGSKINIVIKPIKNYKKAKIKVEYKNNSFSKIISQKEYLNICNSILNIKDKIYTNSKDSIKTRCIDGSFTEIVILKNNINKKYFLDCISPEDKIDDERKSFWYATKLILETVRMKIEDLY